MDGFASGISVPLGTSGSVSQPSNFISSPPTGGAGLIIGPQGGQLVLSNCCNKDFIPVILKAAVVVGSGSPFDCVTANYTIFYLSEFNEWDGYENCDACKAAKIWLSLKCKSNNWTLSVKIVAGKRKITPTMQLTKQDCDSLTLVFSGTIFQTWPIKVTITTAPPGQVLPA